MDTLKLKIQAQYLALMNTGFAMEATKEVKMHTTNQPVGERAALLNQKIFVFISIS